MVRETEMVREIEMVRETEIGEGDGDGEGDREGEGDRDGEGDEDEDGEGDRNGEGDGDGEGDEVRRRYRYLKENGEIESLEINNAPSVIRRERPNSMRPYISDYVRGFFFLLGAPLVTNSAGGIGAPLVLGNYKEDEPVQCPCLNNCLYLPETEIC
jgi:hypothetical protein